MAVLYGIWHHGENLNAGFSSRKITSHRFNVNNNEDESGIDYGVISIRVLMAQLGLLEEFKHQVLIWDDITVLMKEPTGLLGQTDPTSYEMRKMVIQTA